MTNEELLVKISEVGTKMEKVRKELNYVYTQYEHALMEWDKLKTHFMELIRELNKRNLSEK